jgi:hypothetical protein
MADRVPRFFFPEKIVRTKKSEHEKQSAKLRFRLNYETRLDENQ